MYVRPYQALCTRPYKALCIDIKKSVCGLRVLMYLCLCSSIFLGNSRMVRGTILGTLAPQTQMWKDRLPTCRTHNERRRNGAAKDVSQKRIQGFRQYVSSPPSRAICFSADYRARRLQILQQAPGRRLLRRTRQQMARTRT